MAAIGTNIGLPHIGLYMEPFTPSASQYTLGDGGGDAYEV